MGGNVEKDVSNPHQLLRQSSYGVAEFQTNSNGAYHLTSLHGRPKSSFDGPLLRRRIY
jgi:hypothetical protein